MMTVTFPRLIVLLFVAAISLNSAVAEENIFMARSNLDFEVVVEKLAMTLEEYGYKVAHTQRCDGGLNDFGYKTDFYRILFFGKYEEVKALSSKHPAIVPFLPLKILIFAEEGETLLVSMNPSLLTSHFNDPQVTIQLLRWTNDIDSIFTEVSTSWNKK